MLKRQRELYANPWMCSDFETFAHIFTKNIDARVLKVVAKKWQRVEIESLACKSLALFHWNSVSAVKSWAQNLVDDISLEIVMVGTLWWCFPCKWFSMHSNLWLIALFYFFLNWKYECGIMQVAKIKHFIAWVQTNHNQSGEKGNSIEYSTSTVMKFVFFSFSPQKSSYKIKLVQFGILEEILHFNWTERR